MKMNANTAKTLRADGKAVKTAQTRQKLLETGILMFSTNGFNATTTRSVEGQAGVQRNLISYHFGNKENFWKACVVDLFDRFTEFNAVAFSRARDIEPGERIRFLIRQFVRASAAYPEVMRIMFDEGRSNEWRLAWLVEHYTRDFYNTVCELFAAGRSSGTVAGLTVMQFYYLLVSSGAMFAMSPEYQMLAGEAPDSDALIDAQADAIAQLLAPQLTGGNS